MRVTAAVRGLIRLAPGRCQPRGAYRWLLGEAEAVVVGVVDAVGLAVAAGEFGQAAPCGSWVAGQPPDRAGGVGAGSVDAGGDWYGAPVRVEFVQRLRETIRFESPDALVAQLRADERAARAALTQVEA